MYNYLSFRNYTLPFSNAIKSILKCNKIEWFAFIVMKSKGFSPRVYTMLLLWRHVISRSQNILTRELQFNSFLSLNNNRLIDIYEKNLGAIHTFISLVSYFLYLIFKCFFSTFEKRNVCNWMKYHSITEIMKYRSLTEWIK